MSFSQMQHQLAEVQQRDTIHYIISKMFIKTRPQALKVFHKSLCCVFTPRTLSAFEQRRHSLAPYEHDTL